MHKIETLSHKDRKDYLTLRDPLSIATKKTNILFVDDEPRKLEDSVVYLNQNGSFASVAVFTPSGRQDNTDPLTGGYADLSAQITSQLASGNSVIIPLDYSFLGAEPALIDAKENGVVWLQKIMKDFDKQVKTGQLALYANSTADQHVLNFFLELGANGILKKGCPQQELLETLEVASWKSRVTQLLNEGDHSVVSILTTATIRKLIPGTDPEFVALRHSLLGSLGFISAVAHRGEERFNRRSHEAFTKISNIILSIIQSKTLSAAEIATSLSANLENLIWLDLDPEIRSPMFLPNTNTPERALITTEIQNPDLKLWLFNTIKTIESNAFDAEATVLFPFMHMSDSDVVIAFTNNGQSIQKEVLSRLGKQGVSTKGKERGIGLASCAATARKLGIDLIVAQKEFGFKYSLHSLVSQENSEISIDQLQQQDPVQRAIMTSDVDIFEYCQRNIMRYQSLPLLTFMAKIPLSAFQ